MAGARHTVCRVLAAPALPSQLTKRTAAAPTPSGPHRITARHPIWFSSPPGPCQHITLPSSPPPLALSPSLGALQQLAEGGALGLQLRLAPLLLLQGGPSVTGCCSWLLHLPLFESTQPTPPPSLHPPKQLPLQTQHTVEEQAPATRQPTSFSFSSTQSSNSSSRSLALSTACGARAAAPQPCLDECPTGRSC